MFRSGLVYVQWFSLCFSCFFHSSSCEHLAEQFCQRCIHPNDMQLLLSCCESRSMQWFAAVSQLHNEHLPTWSKLVSVSMWERLSIENSEGNTPFQTKNTNTSHPRGHEISPAWPYMTTYASSVTLALATLTLFTYFMPFTNTEVVVQRKQSFKRYNI